MQLNVSRYDGFAPLEDLEESFVILRDRRFCRQHSKQGHCNVLV